MPELPEVETTLRGIQPHIQQQTITQIILRHTHLRWPIPLDIDSILAGQKIQHLERRAKYLLLHFKMGTLMIHLGMSGSLRLLSTAVAPKKHDHIDVIFSPQQILRFTDPRRFGAFLWTTEPLNHPLLKNLGPEPLEKNFSGKYLAKQAKNKIIAVKNFIMDSKIVVGVGNIYAAEALFLANIHPLTPVKQLTAQQWLQLTHAIKKILRCAISQGGTTLKDFTHSTGKPGYFKQSLKVYGRGGLPCVICHTLLQSIRLGQRSTVFCAVCQKK